MDLSQIIFCANLCKASYDDSDNRFVTVDELRFGVIRDSSIAYVVNRGTSNLDGWLDDLEALPAGVDEDGSFVHKGFLEAVNKVWPMVMNELPKGGSIVCTGHSLGGAMAALMGKRLRCPIVTFGEPRQQRQSGPDPYLVAEHYRIINSADPVVHVPDGELWFHTVKPYIDLIQENDTICKEMHAPIQEAYIDRLNNFQFV